MLIYYDTSFQSRVSLCPLYTLLFACQLVELTTMDATVSNYLKDKISMTMSMPSALTGLLFNMCSTVNKYLPPS